MSSLAELGIAFRRGFGRITPEPFIIAVASTLLVFLAALCVGDLPEGAATGLSAWVGSAGLWQLGRFAMQISVMLVMGTVLAEAPPVRRLLEGLVGRARSPRALVALVAFTACALSLINWSLGLIGGAVLARGAARVIRDRDWQLHYPLVCAAGYAGLMVWHGGLSGSAPLKVTQNRDLVGVLGEDLAGRVGELGLDQTLFGSLNLAVSGGLLLLAPVIFAALTPSRGCDPSAAAPPATSAPPQADASVPASESRGDSTRTWLDRVDDAPLWSYLLALCITVAVGLQMHARGWLRLDLDTVNALLWASALVAQRRPKAFLAACENAVRSCSGVIVTFPLYAGIMAVMSMSGLSEQVTELVASAGRAWLPVLTFFSAAGVNLFVPSGGGQWAVQGPIIMEAALASGSSPASIVMALAYGDQLTNMLQPFWALPLLAVTGVRARDIVGYCVIWMLVGAMWSVVMLLAFG